jgi:hypothetical protein
MRVEKKYYVLLIGAVLVVLWFLIGTYGDTLTCLEDRFPEEYDVNSVIIYNYRSTMIGRYDIVIKGNGSAYYFNDIPDNFANIEEGWKTESRHGILSQEKIKEIVDLFKENKFFCMKDDYDPLIYLFSATDLGMDYVSFTINGMTKTVKDYGKSSPYPMRKIIYELRNSVKDSPQIEYKELREKMCNVIIEELSKVPKVNTRYFMDYCLMVANSSLQ